MELKSISSKKMYTNLKNKRIIGFVGKKNSGKDTAGDYLINRFNYIRYAFGDPVKKICKILFNLSEEQLNDRVLKEAIDNRWGISPREMFQKIGTEFGQDMIFTLFPKLKNNISFKQNQLWVNLCKSWLDNIENKDKNIVITDVRFKHEAEFIKNQGGLLIHIYRDISNSSNDCHVSETEINDIIKDKNLIDFEVDNNFQLLDLYSQIDKIIYVPF